VRSGSKTSSQSLDGAGVVCVRQVSPVSCLTRRHPPVFFTKKTMEVKCLHLAASGVAAAILVHYFWGGWIDVEWGMSFRRRGLGWQRSSSIGCAASGGGHGNAQGSRAFCAASAAAICGKRCDFCYDHGHGTPRTRLCIWSFVSGRAGGHFYRRAQCSNHDARRS
jgi:hypothetical protein